MNFTDTVHAENNLVFTKIISRFLFLQHISYYILKGVELRPRYSLIVDEDVKKPTKQTYKKHTFELELNFAENTNYSVLSEVQYQVYPGAIPIADKATSCFD